MKSTLVKIIPEGMDPEFMVVTTESSTQENEDTSIDEQTKNYTPHREGDE